MQTFFTHMPRPLRPPGRSTLSLLSFLLLLLPAWSIAQSDCFSNFNAGDNQTWCEGEAAILDGGYSVYDEPGNNPDLGTPTVTWSVDPASPGSGTFSFDGSTGLATVQNVNFNNSENGITSFPDVTFLADAGVTEVILRISGTTNDGPCSAVTESEAVTIFFDPVKETPIDATLDDDDNPLTTVLNDAVGTGNTISAGNGDKVTLLIDDNFAVDNGLQFDDILRYNVSYSGVIGMLGMSGLPAEGNYTENEFEVAFNDLTLANMTCDDFVATLEVFAFYDRSNTGAPAPSGECPGPVTAIEFTIAPRDAPTATLGANQLLEVCADDTDFTINITGTINTEVTYQINGIPQDPALVLDADGFTTIAFDATQYPGAETVNIVLTGASFLSGAPCPATFSKPLQVTIIPLPTLTAELVNSEDEVICNIANGGPTTLPFRLTTNGPAGSYDFTIEEFADGQLVESTDLTRNFADNGDGTASFTGTLDINGFGGSDIISNAPLTGGEMTYVVDGASFGPTDDGNVTTAECPNDEPDASFTFEIQKESFVEVEINDSKGGTILLQNNSETPDGEAITSADVTFCDGETFTLAVVAPTGNNASPTILGSVALVDVQITDADGLLTAASGIYNFTDNGFDINQVLNIPNNQTDDSEFTIVLTPFIDNDGDGLFNDDGSTDDCEGNALTVNVTLRPAPTVTVAPLDPVCEGETITVVITASEPGTATLTVGQGGAGTTVPITENGGIFTGEFTSEELSAGMNQFTVTTFDGNVANCSATVNQMVMVDVEDNPNAAISVDDTDLCDGEEATVTLTGSEGSETGYDFDIEVTYDGGAIGPANATQTTVSTDAGESTLELSTTDLAGILFGAGSAVAEGTYTVAISRVANQSTLACDTDVDETEVIVSIEVEGVPAVSCTAPEAPICSGDDYTFTLNADSELTSAIGSSLYYSVVTTTTTFNPISNQFEDNVSNAEIFEATAAGVEITGTGENMSGFDQTISIEATPFYFNDKDGTPVAADFAAACQGEETECSVAVRTMPMATFGGDSQLCEGQTGFQTFTGPPGATFNGSGEDEDGNQLLVLPGAQFDAGGSIVVELPGIFVVQNLDFIIRDLTTAEGCTSAMEFEFDLNVTPTPEAEFVDADLTVCEGDSPSIALTGTPGAVVTLSPADLGPVTLDANGDGSFMIDDASADLTVTIDEISFTEDDQNGDDFTCTGTSDSELELTVNPAPTGALVSNSVLCTSDSPEVQFNLTTLNDDLSGTFDIVVNGILFEDVINGEVLDFTGTAFATLTENTDFVLTSITESDTELACIDIIDGDIFTETVEVNETPVVNVSDVPAEICSGDDLAITSSSTPISRIGANGNVLFYQLTLNDGVGAPPASPVVSLVSAAEVDANGLNAALGLPDEFVNGSTTDNDNISFTVQPYYEANSEAGEDPFGIFDCGDVMSGFGTNGFNAADWDTDRTTDAGDVSFTATELTLTLVDTDNDGVLNNGGDDNNFDRAEARYEVLGTGNLSFDFEYDINDQGFFGIPLDFFIIDFEGNTIFRNFTTTEGQFTTSGGGITVDGGSEIVFQLRDVFNRFFDGQSANSTATISNFAFTPACQPCPGEPVDVVFEVLPALFADFSSAPEHVCKGDNAEICLTGTPDATVTVFYDGIYNDVKLDASGSGCFSTVGGLLKNTDFLILGLTTLDDMPQCSFTFEDGLWPTAPVVVVPEPTATISLEPTTVCADDEAIAIVTGTPNAVVSYEYNNSPVGDVELDEDGNGSITLNTENTGTANIVCHVILTDISVTVGDITCTNNLTDQVTLTVRPRPAGTITAGAPACAGEKVPVTFNATTTPLDTYTLVIEGPGLEAGGTTYEGVTNGGVVLMAEEAGEFTLVSITDGTDSDPDISCSNTVEETTTVVIEEKPNLTAAITGTVGTANLDSDHPIFKTFRALACDEATMNTVFGTSTASAVALGDLKVYVEVSANDEGQANVGPASESVIDFADLNDEDFLDGILENVADLDVTSIEVELTPFFENGADAGALEAEDCSGGTLSFFIDILPEVEFTFDDSKSSATVCEGEDISIAISGSPGAEVMFTSAGFTLTGDSEGSSITIGDEGTAAITGTALAAGTASVTVDMVLLTTIEGNISRQCMLMEQGGRTILINEVPEAELSVLPEGPICNDETVDVTVSLVNTDFEAGDLFTFVVDGQTYADVAVNGHGEATLFTSSPLTEMTVFSLTSVTNVATGCELAPDEAISMATIMVEEIPAGEVIVTIDGEETTVSGGVPAEFQICANERVDVAAADTNDEAPLVGEDYVSVVFSISENIDFFGLGQSGTVALPIEDFEDQFSREYNMISGNQVTIELAVTYYNETDGPEGATLDSDECAGITDNITIIINPNPKTEDVMTTTCSGEALNYDLDEAIVNGVLGATFSYTVASDDVDVSGLDRTDASDANITDEFDNFSDGEYTLVYTVTPFGTDGDEACQGNDFDLVVTIKPEPVITAGQTAEVCSGEETLCIIMLDNETDGEDNLTGDTDQFEVISISFSDDSDDFVAGAENAEVGDVGDLMVIADDEFTNTTSGPVTVTYVIRPTSAHGCIGADETIVVTILPEAVVADFMIKVCSGGEINLGFDALSENGVGDVLSFVRTAGTAVTLLRIFDETDADVTGEAWFGGSASNPGVTAINDSYLNTGTGTLSVFYAVSVAVRGADVDGEPGQVCDAETFILEVKVVEEADVELELAGATSNICEGEPITLHADYDGSGSEVTYEYSFTSEDGVVLDLEPSLSGAEVTVSAVSGSGVATVMVMVTDDNSCVAMSTRPVGVGETPEEMDIAGFEDPCVGEFNFNAYSIAATEGSTYEWGLSNPAAGVITDNSTNGDVVNISFNASQGVGPFEVTVTETTAAGCSATSSLTVTLFEETVVDFAAIESEGDPLTYDFTELAGGGAQAYIWDFGDGNTSNEQNPSHTYAPADPTAMQTYTVTLTVLGCSGAVSSSKDITINSDLVMDEINLVPGLNFISFDVDPVDNSVDAVFAGINAQRITTMSDNAASAWFPGLGAFNNLQTIEPGFGYLVVMNEPATLAVMGTAANNVIRPMGPGYNFINFVPEDDMVAEDFMAPMEVDNNLIVAKTFGDNVPGFIQDYFPGFAAFSSLQYMANGLGYMVRTNNGTTGGVGRVATNASATYDFVYGTVGGVDYQPGDVVEILNSEGDVVGELTPDETGLFKATPLYGRVELEGGEINGVFDAGEAVSFRYRGQVIDAGVAFQGTYDGTEVNLDFNNTTDLEATSDRLSMSVQPNPAYEFTSIVVKLEKAATIDIHAVDAMGRIVKQLLPKQVLTAGTTSIDWNNMGELPAGMYHVIVVRDGRVLTDVTQRVVKR